MKKTMIFAITAAFAIILTAAPNARAQVKHVAVVETERDPTANISRAEAMEITAVLRREAINNLPRGKYNIMTNETIMSMGGAVLEECAEENCVISLGERIGADYVVRGMIRKIGTKLSLTVEIHEIDQGMLVVLSDPVRAEKIEDLLDMATGACGSMYKKFLNDVGGTHKTTTQQTTMTPTPTYQQSAPTPTLGTFTDKRDGKTYKTVVIGGKRWMAENLNYQPQKGQSWCYDNDNYNCDKYGRLYDWNMAKTVCPAGFHLPSRHEWNSLVTMVGGDKAAGNNLKAGSGWNYKGKTRNGTDNFGFSALPGGVRDCYSGKFSGIGNEGAWWTYTDYSNARAYYRYIYSNKDHVSEYDTYYGYGYSVRCIQD